MVGAKNIKDIILKDKLIFLYSILCLPDHAAPKHILLAHLSSSSPRSWTNSMQHHLDALNLPDIPTLVANTPSAGICCTKPGAPAPHRKITHSADLLHLTTRSNFRVRLLLGCHGLESDAARFRVRRDGSPTGNPMCKLCNSEEEDPVHFLAVCNALQARQVLLSHAPTQPT